MRTDKHLQISTTKTNAYQVEMIYVGAGKIFEAGKVQPTYEAALEAGARMAVQTGVPLLAWGYAITGPQDTAALAAAVRAQEVYA